MNQHFQITEITTDDQMEELIIVLQASFGTVAEEFHLTGENAPTNPA
ncbi:MAG: hypothetical protein P8107_12515 [Spirochaetia bacterium]